LGRTFARTIEGSNEVILEIPSTEMLLQPVVMEQLELRGTPWEVIPRVQVEIVFVETIEIEDF